jgi:hypothetical protein
MRRLRLRNLIVRLWLSSVYHIGELHGILNEEYRNVVANNVPVTLFSVELDSKSTDIADGVCGSTATKHSREPQEYRSLARSISQNASRRDVLGRLIEGELSKGTGTTGVDNALGDALVIEAVDLGRVVSCVCLPPADFEYTFSRPK